MRNARRHCAGRVNYCTAEHRQLLLTHGPIFGGAALSYDILGDGILYVDRQQSRFSGEFVERYVLCDPEQKGFGGTHIFAGAFGAEGPKICLLSDIFNILRTRKKLCNEPLQRGLLL